MKKNILIYAFLVLLVVLIIFGLIKLISSTSTKNIDEANIEEKEIYLNIVKDEEKTGELSIDLNGEKTKYYYFDIVNYNIEENKYNQKELIPFIKVEFQGNEYQYLKYNLFYINDEADNEADWTEITEKGDTGSNFEEYYKGVIVYPYNADDIESNSFHYALKLALEGDAERFETIEEDLIENFSIILGYRENK